MANRRTLSWSTSMREMRDMAGDRSRRASIREERLRATAGLREPPALTSWRGLSGRRYVVGVHALGETDIEELTDAVLIAVERTGDGTAKVLDVAAPGAQTPSRSRSGWLSRMRARGATEMHVHRLAASEEERRAVMADLLEQAS
jgi:hypothetical protein